MRPEEVCPEVWGQGGEVVVVVALFNRARTPFSEQGGSGTCPPRHSPKGFFRNWEKTSSCDKKEREKAPHTYLRLSRTYSQKDGTSLSRMSFTPLGQQGRGGGGGGERGQQQ